MLTHLPEQNKISKRCESNVQAIYQCVAKEKNEKLVIAKIDAIINLERQKSHQLIEQKWKPSKNPPKDNDDPFLKHTFHIRNNDELDQA